MRPTYCAELNLRAPIPRLLTVQFWDTPEVGGQRLLTRRSRWRIVTPFFYSNPNSFTHHKNHLSFSTQFKKIAKNQSPKINRQKSAEVLSLVAAKCASPLRAGKRGSLLELADGPVENHRPQHAPHMSGKVDTPPAGPQQHVTRPRQVDHQRQLQRLWAATVVTVVTVVSDVTVTTAGRWWRWWRWWSVVTGIDGGGGGKA